MSDTLPLTRAQPLHIQKAIIMFVGVFAAFGAAAGPDVSVSNSKAMLDLMAKRNPVFEDYLLKEVRNRLKDPESARFRNLVRHGLVIVYPDGTRVPYNHTTVCGEVNAKNSLGGYTGFSRFWATIDWDEGKRNFRDGSLSVEFLPEGNEPSVQEKFDEAYDRVCRDAIYQKK